MEDMLREYIKPEMIEKSPADFTSKIMIKLQEGTLTEPVKRSRKLNYVPLISAAVTLLLTAAALILPASEPESLTLPFLKLMKNLKLSIPSVDLASIFKFNLPSVMIYVFFGILVLTLIDRALYGIFHNGNRSNAESGN